MSNKQFSNRLNQELDNIGVPAPNEERIKAFSQLIDIPKFQAEAFLNGVLIPNETILHSIAEELEVNPDWLIGKSDHRLQKKKGN